MLNVQKESANLLKHSAAVWSCRCLRDPAPHAVDDLHKKKRKKEKKLAIALSYAKIIFKV